MIWTIILISTVNIPWVPRRREFQSNPTNSCANELFNSGESFFVTNKNKWYKSPEINWSVPWSIFLIPNKIQHQNRFMKTHRVGLLCFLIPTTFGIYKKNYICLYKSFFIYHDFYCWLSFSLNASIFFHFPSAIPSKEDFSALKLYNKHELFKWIDIHHRFNTFTKMHKYIHRKW